MKINEKSMKITNFYQNCKVLQIVLKVDWGHPGHAHAAGNGSQWPATRATPLPNKPRVQAGGTHTLSRH